MEPNVKLSWLLVGVLTIACIVLGVKLKQSSTPAPSKHAKITEYVSSTGNTDVVLYEGDELTWEIPPGTSSKFTSSFTVGGVCGKSDGTTIGVNLSAQHQQQTCTALASGAAFISNVKAGFPVPGGQPGGVQKLSTIACPRGSCCNCAGAWGGSTGDTHKGGPDVLKDPPPGPNGRDITISCPESSIPDTPIDTSGGQTTINWFAKDSSKVSIKFKDATPCESSPYSDLDDAPAVCLIDEKPTQKTYPYTFVTCGGKSSGTGNLIY
jgi:hypothetical protein